MRRLGKHQTKCTGILSGALDIHWHTEIREQMMGGAQVQGYGVAIALQLRQCSQSEVRAADFKARLHGRKGSERLVETVFSGGAQLENSDGNSLVSCIPRSV